MLKVEISTAAAQRATSELRADLKLLGLDTKLSTNQIKKLEDRLQKKMGADAARSSIDRLKKSVGLTTREVQRLERRLGGARTYFTQFGAAAKKVGGTLLSLKTLFVALGGALVVGSIVKAGATFERKMAKVKAITEATTKQFREMTKIAKFLGETTEWTATQAAGGLEFLTMAGFKVKDAIAALPGVLNLATAGGLEVARAADIATNALTAMQIPVSELSKVNDVFTKTITNSNTNMEMMAESFKYAAPVANAYGYTMEKLAALVGTLGNAGIQGSMAGTQLAFSFQRVSKVLKGTKREGGDLIDAIKLMNEEQWENDRVMKAFGLRGGRAVLVLKKMVDKYGELHDKTMKAKGATDQMAKTMQDNLIGDAKKLSSVLEGIKIKAFESNVGGLREGVQALTSAFQDNKDEIGHMLDALGVGLKGLSNFGSGVIGLTGYILKNVRAWGMLSGSIKNYNEAMSLAERGADKGPETTKEFIERNLSLAKQTLAVKQRQYEIYKDAIGGPMKKVSRDQYAAAKADLEKWETTLDNWMARLERKKEKAKSVKTDEEIKKEAEGEFLRTVGLSGEELAAQRDFLTKKIKLTHDMTEQQIADEKQLWIDAGANRYVVEEQVEDKLKELTEGMIEWRAEKLRESIEEQKAMAAGLGDVTFDAAGRPEEDWTTQDWSTGEQGTEFDWNKWQEEQERMYEHMDIRTEMTAEQIEKEKQLWEKAGGDRYWIEKVTKEKIDKLGREETAYKVQRFKQEKAQAINNLENTLAYVASRSKTAFVFYQLYEIAKATIAGITAAIHAWKWGWEIGGPPLAIAFSGASLAWTAAQIAQIKAQEAPSMHTGGVVPGTGDVDITAKGGEGIVSNKGMEALDKINKGSPESISGGYVVLEFTSENNFNISTLNSTGMEEVVQNDIRPELEKMMENNYEDFNQKLKEAVVGR